MLLSDPSGKRQTAGWLRIISRGYIDIELCFTCELVACHIWGSHHVSIVQRFDPGRQQYKSNNPRKAHSAEAVQ